MLGITPATLRRWVDDGDVAAFVTPGGHRRFPRAVIEQLVPQASSRRKPLKSVDASAARVTRGYRRSSERAGTSLDDRDRAEFRARGQRLLMLLIAHLNEDGRPRARLEPAMHEAADYGRRAAILGTPISEAIDAFIRFRKAFMSELAASARRRHLTAGELTVLILEAEQALDQLLAALTDGYSGERG